MKKIIFITFFCLLFSQNTSFDFTNGTYGRIPMSESLSNFSEFTMEFWYYETGGHGSDEMIVGTEFFSGSRYGVYSFIDGFWPYISNGEDWLGIQYNGSNGSAGISYSSFNWYHLAFSYDGNTFRFFINGDIVFEQEGDVDFFGSSSEDLVINRHTWNSGSSSRLSGHLDELRISDIARYTENFTPQNYEFSTDANTMGLWHFNNDFNDYSGNGNHGAHNGTGYSYNTPEFIEIVLGCTDEEACNYNIDSTDDDGSCEYPEENYDCSGDCILDIDCSGECGGNLVFDNCGVCGGDNSSCFGCTYETATNYNPNSTYDDASCEFLWGDINMDGTLSISDIVLLVQMILENEW